MKNYPVGKELTKDQNILLFMRDVPLICSTEKVNFTSNLYKGKLFVKG